MYHDNMPYFMPVRLYKHINVYIVQCYGTVPYRSVILTVRYRMSVCSTALL